MNIDNKHIQFDSKAWQNAHNAFMKDPKNKEWWNSLDEVMKARIEAYSKAIQSELVDCECENAPKTDIHYFDIPTRPMPEIVFEKDLPKNNLNKQALLDEFNKKHPLPTAKEIEEMAPKMPSKEKLHELAQAFKNMYDPKYNTATVDGYDFVCTCHACPEQYDVYKGGYEHGEYVAYVRKRWGHLTVDLVKNDEITDNCIYSESDGDAWSGTIENREEMFKNIVNALNKTL